jgi:hypothetical protein
MLLGFRLLAAYSGARASSLREAASRLTRSSPRLMPTPGACRAASMHVEYPMLFKAESTSSGRFTHCGVLEFVAEEGVVYMPHWVSRGGPACMHASTGHWHA